MSFTDSVIPPAGAYELVVAAINDPRYFRSSPPDEGVRVFVTGTDNVPTEWDFEPAMAERVLTVLSKTPGVYRLASKPYRIVGGKR